MICLAPVAVLPGLHNRWEWPTLLCVVAATLLTLWARPAGRLPRWFVMGLAGVSALLVVSALLGQAPLVQLLGRAPRYEGFLALAAVGAAVWVGARLFGPRASVRAGRQAIIATALSSLLLGEVAVLESIGLRPFATDLARPGSLAGNATDQAILGVVAVAVLGFLALGAWRRTGQVDGWALAGSLAGGVSVATSASRAGMLALAVVIVALTCQLVATATDRRRAAVVGVAGALAVCGAVLALPLTRERLFGGFDFAQQTIGDRLLMWQDAWALFLAHPWLGVGPNGFADAVTPFQGDEWYARVGVGPVLDSPHNVVLQVAVVGGVAGLVLGSLIVAGVVASGLKGIRTSDPRRDLRLGALVALGAAGLALLTHPTSPVTLVPLAVLAGALLAVPANGSPGRSARITASLIVGLWGAFLLVSTSADAALLDAQRAAAAGQLDRSQASFTRAQALRPWDPDIALLAVSTLGTAVEHGLPEAADPAEEWAQLALKALPGSSRANYLAGMVAAVRGDTETAVSRLSLAARLSPADPRIAHGLGLAHLAGGDPDGAIAPLTRAADLAPESVVTWQALGAACAAVGDAACVERAERGAADAVP
ncbi:O-antigen ligase family protein [Salana multivorans]